MNDRDAIAAARAAFAQELADAPVCDHHDTWDENLEPTGDACGKPAEFLIVWKESKRVSFACVFHATDINAAAEEYVLSRLVDTRSESDAIGYAEKNCVATGGHRYGEVSEHGSWCRNCGQWRPIEVANVIDGAVVETES